MSIASIRNRIYTGLWFLGYSLKKMQPLSRYGNGARSWLAVAMLFCLCVIMFVMLSTMGGQPQLGGRKWRPYRDQQFKDHSWFERTCLQTGKAEVFEDLKVLIDEWRQASSSDCRQLYNNFLKLLRVTFQEGDIVIPPSYTSKVRKWLGNNEELFKEAKTQTIISVYNRYTHEQNIYNPIRNKRPMSVPKMPERQYIDERVKETRAACDFCNYKGNTAEDVFGRIDNKYSYSASNTFKLDRWHALFILKSHHPLNWTREHFLDLMHTGEQWFSKVRERDAMYKYPSMIWDLLPHAGASQVHPHVHGFIDKDAYQGAMELWRKAAVDYSEDVPNHNYFVDLLEIHSVLGLSVSFGTAAAFANLVPKRDNEIVIISETANKDFYLLWYFVIRAYLDDMGSGSLCFSSGIAFPSMIGDTSSNSLPAYVRILTRGPVADVRSDVSSLELFMASNANTDPFKLMEVIRESVHKRGFDVR